jgi:hypothetical protein
MNQGVNTQKEPTIARMLNPQGLDYFNSMLNIFLYGSIAI